MDQAFRLRRYALRCLTVLFSVSLIIWITSGILPAQTTAFNYQGNLQENGTHVTGVFDFQFTVYDTLEDGAGEVQGGPLIMEEITVSQGQFITEVDFGDIFDGSDRYLEIGIRPGGSDNDFLLLSPRQRITFVPHAIRALKSGDSLLFNGLDPSRFVQFDENGNVGLGPKPASALLSISGSGISSALSAARFDLFNNVADFGFMHHLSDNGIYRITSTVGLAQFAINQDGNVGIGNSSPHHRLRISGGPLWTTNAWTGSVEIDNAGAIGWRANAGGQRFGIGQSGGGLYIFRTSSDPGTTGSPANYIALFSDSGNVGIGTTAPTLSRLQVDGGNSPGVYGISSANRGVWGQSSTGQGVYGYSNGNAGLVGESQNFDGIYGVSHATSGGAGVSGRNDSTQGYGVWGSAGYDGYGVYGTGYHGVYGISTWYGGEGVVGIANNGPNAYGIWGQSTGGNAGRFSGSVVVNGSLTKASGSFKIDHPLDPANKYLSHSFVESPDMMNIYNGTVILDSNGEADITMPEWFEALNRDFQYQLTCIGEYAPVYVASEIKDNRFRIAGGRPGLKVSWQVTGIRHDSWANDHRIMVEENKQADQRGTYLYPEGVNQPEEKGEEWVHHPETMRKVRDLRESYKRQQAATH